MAATGLFAQENALVTGSASNIGRAIAEGLAAEGAHVTLADIDSGRNAQTAAAIRDSGGKCTELTIDLSAKDGWRELTSLYADNCLDIFVHSACPPRSESDTVRFFEESTLDAMMNVGFRSGLLFARSLGDRMIDTGTKGRMLFITSLHAHAPRNLVHYSATKAAMAMVVKELARDLAPHSIRVNAIAPGALPGGGNTNITEEFAVKIPMGRVGKAEDIVGPALALLSDKFCGYVTGTTLPVDGGLALYNWIPYSED